VLAATAVVRTGLYATAFDRLGRAVLYPGSTEQEQLQRIIRVVKTGQYGRPETDVLQAACDGLIEAGAQALVIACTELSVIAAALRPAGPMFDASQVLAAAIVKEAAG
jgi:aspartate racemase